MVWLDGLDIPLVRFSTPASPRRARRSRRRRRRPEGDRAGIATACNLLPLDLEQQPHEPTRVFVYPFAKTREVAASASLEARSIAHHGFKLRFVNPATGRSPMPTIGTFAQRLPKASRPGRTRSSDSTVHVCLEGGGTATIGSAGGSSSAGATSSSCRRGRRSPSPPREDSILFSFSDRPVQQVLGLWREQRLDWRDAGERRGHAAR